MTTPFHRMPVVFFGHGSPMIALETNATTERWQQIGARIARPAAILCISAHWYTRGSAVTAMAKPQTIHDFGGFPRELHQMQYPAPGSPELAARVREVLAPLPVSLDESWGLDHGTWSVLTKVYPQADIPVVQLSMDASRPPAHHFEIGRRLAPLREEGVLILGTGNIVHNLPAMHPARDAPPYIWAADFDRYVRAAIVANQPAKLVEYHAAGRDAQLSVPTPDHYWPLLYVLGARHADDVPHFEVEGIEHGSLSMMTVRFDRLLAEG